MKHSHIKPLSLKDMPSVLKDSYRRFALVANRAHVEHLGPDDGETLIVSCDWVLCQELIRAERHAIYYEWGIMAWDTPDTLDTDLFLHANDWIEDAEGNDPTVFRGVSLGRLFGAELSMATMNYYRLERALRKLIEKFKPGEILFYDFIYDVNLLSLEMRSNLARAIAGECGVRFEDRSAGTPEQEHDIAEAVFVRKGHRRIKQILLDIYAWTLETLSRLRCFFSNPEKRVLVLVNSNIALPLVGNFPGGGITPMFFARTIPRKFGLLWHCLKQGVLLVAPRPLPLSTEDRLQIGEIEKALIESLSRPAGGVLGFARSYVRALVLESGRLREFAGEIRKAERLLDRYGPKNIVVDGVRHQPPRIYIELARARNIGVDYIWHSPLTPQTLKMDALGGDEKFSAVVTRCLSWGAINEKWLDHMEARQPRVRVGAPLYDKYAGAGSVAGPVRDKAPKDPAQTNVLLLQYTFVVTDLAGLNANMYEHFTGTVQELRRLGYENISYKLHPSLGRWRKSYLEKINKTFGLGCKVLKLEPFQDCLAWADIVIGPTSSGSLFETLSAGMPYHAFLLDPHSQNPGYYEGFPILSAVSQLPEAIRRGTETEGKKLLNCLYSCDEISSPSTRFWEVLENDFA